MHLVLALEGRLRVRTAGPPGWQAAAGVLTAPDAEHAIDTSGQETLLVFLDPESDAGRSLRGALSGPARLVSGPERDFLAREASPPGIMARDGEPWIARALEVLRAPAGAARRAVHPRRRLLRLLASGPKPRGNSREELARAVELSPGRLMHVFNESIGIPIRPYLLLLKLQRAAGAIAAGMPLAEAALAAGFADSAHMRPTFRRMLGAPPSSLRARRASRAGSAPAASGVRGSGRAPGAQSCRRDGGGVCDAPRVPVTGRVDGPLPRGEAWFA